MTLNSFSPFAKRRIDWRVSRTSRSNRKTMITIIALYIAAGAVAFIAHGV